MTEFNKFKELISNKFEKLSTNELFRASISKDDLWSVYLGSFPEGSNPIFRERTTHDCQCCKQFIRACGDVVAIVDGELISIWDIEIGGDYQVVADAMSSAVKSHEIENIFFHYEKNLGTDHGHQLIDGQSHRFDHFHYRLPSKFVKSKDAINSYLGGIRSNKDVFKRSLIEINETAIEVVIELIDQNSLYRGEEHKSIVELLLRHKIAFNESKNKDHYAWLNSLSLGNAAKIRNTVIGTLLTDISDGVELDRAVASFEAKVAPQNYKRPTAVVTQGMVKKAQEKAEELGIEPSLYRRYAIIDDITANNILFADRSAKEAMGVFDGIAKEITVSSNKLSKAEEVSITDFIENILPKSTSIELLMENSHQTNLVSLIAPINFDSPNILKWDNNFSWSYNGEVADSMKERVSKAGGNIVADLRFSIQWNDGDENQNDFDAHCYEPSGNKITYKVKRIKQLSSGMLDVDITQPGNNVAVENITWTDKVKMPIGDYKMLVHNFSHNGGRTGFTAQIEFDGKIHDFSYDKNVPNESMIDVAIVNWDGSEFSIKESLPSSQSSREIWGVKTHSFTKARMIMNSPNHWNSNKAGNKHWIFVLENCLNPDKSRGFYNEFLKPELIEYRKVFEILGSKTKTDKSDNQLSGLGFSSTQRNHVFCKVTGSFTRTIKVIF